MNGGHRTTRRAGGRRHLAGMNAAHARPAEPSPGTALLGTSGVRRVVARRPLTAFFAITFGVGWPVLALPLLADRGVIGTGALPAEMFALGVTWFVMLPAALWVTAVSEGAGAARSLLRRLLRWRLAAWWAAILLALPLTTVGVGLLLGGSLGTDDPAASLLQGVVLLISAVLLIHVWEETVWAGFVQTRLERRHSLVVAALLTAIPFSAIHVPIILIGASQILPALGGVMVLGVGMRLLVGVFMRGTGASLLAAGLVHGVYNACNNDGALVDAILLDADQNLAAPIALVLVTTAAAAVIARRHSAHRGADIHAGGPLPAARPALHDMQSAQRGITRHGTRQRRLEHLRAHAAARSGTRGGGAASRPEEQTHRAAAR
jgi:membrane protease YdiL (CAAX protease family)